MVQTTPQIFTIGDWNIDKLKKKINTINNRADKLNCPRVVLELSNPQSVVAPEYRKYIKSHGADQLPHIVIVDVTITGDGPQLAGWKFLGTLDHHTIPGKVAVRAVPGEEIPSRFFVSSGVCDHCGKLRSRKETFVVEHDTGNHKQIGRQCIKDFLGSDPRQMVSYMTSLFRLVDEIKDDRNFGSLYGGDLGFSSDTILQVSAAIIDVKGWVSKSSANENLSSTASDVHYYLSHPTDHRERSHWNEWKSQFDVDNDKHTTEINKARVWLNEQQSTNSYIHNLKALQDLDVVPHKMQDYWVSLISAYRRTLNSATPTNKTVKLNEYVGNKKERLNFTLTVVNKRVIEGYYGNTTIFNMLDTKGRTIVWFASGSSDMHKGCTYETKATIKTHSEYNEWKQTIVTRLSVLEETNAN